MASCILQPKAMATIIFLKPLPSTKMPCANTSLTAKKITARNLKRSQNTMNKQGLFLVLEGGEGVGKTTNMAFIQDYLKQQNIGFVHSREPGGTDISEQIRSLMLD